MKLLVPSTRQAEIVVAAALAATAVVVVWESVKLGSGWAANGPQAGFFPFWSALTLLATALITLVGALRRSATGLLVETPEQARDVLKVGLPLAAAVLSIQLVGFYLMTALYVAFFGIWFGRYRWYLAVLAGLVLAVSLYFGFERGFRIGLPKSVLYGDGFPL